MQPVGGLTLLVNLLIIILGSIKKKISRVIHIKIKIKLPRYLPYFIIAFSVIAASWGLIFFLNSSFRGDSNFYKIYEVYYKCEPFEQTQSDRIVVIRIDDVQAYAWNEASISMIEDSMEKRVPVVLGVIPYRVEDDKLLIASMKKNLCNLEIAQHGWSNDENTHETEISESFEESEMVKRLAEGKSVLERVAGENISTFIPPTNINTNKSIEALSEAGFKTISSQGNTTYDYTTMTYDYEKGVYFSVDKIMVDCEKAFSKKKVCVIMTHPQDFVTNGKLDPEKYQIYLDMIDELQKRNVSFARFSNLESQEKTKSYY